MRILLTNHFPLSSSPSGVLVESLGRWLVKAGHQVRMLVLRSRDDPPEPEVRSVICDPADAHAALPMPLPTFDGSISGMRFRDLTDEQLLTYRDVLREAIDREIDAFDPHILHAQHVWIQGHLALEAGVPYVLTAWGEEFETMAADDRWDRYARQAAENAGRIFVPNERLQSTVQAAFGDLEERVQVCDCTVPVSSACGEQLVTAYRAVVVERFGSEPE
ncbi:MAG TPA: glycosyltransferase [Pirellulales bacterium]|nr:glycosyltransferase [Pirellulales bacterium]